MNLSDDLMADVCAALTDDFDRFELDDNHFVVLRIEHDPDSSINDADCYGLTEKYSHSYHERAERPSNMDGSARKIQTDRGSWIWWQPADDMKSKKQWTKGFADAGIDPEITYEEAFRRHVELARELLEEGFKQVGVKLYEWIADSLGNLHPVKLGEQWIGGVDSVDNGYLAHLIPDLIADLPKVTLV